MNVLQPFQRLRDIGATTNFHCCSVTFETCYHRTRTTTSTGSPSFTMGSSVTATAWTNIATMLLPVARRCMSQTLYSRCFSNVVNRIEAALLYEHGVTSAQGEELAQRQRWMQLAIMHWKCSAVSNDSSKVYCQSTAKLLSSRCGMPCLQQRGPPPRQPSHQPHHPLLCPTPSQC